MKSTFKILTAAAAIGCAFPSTGQTFSHNSVLAEGNWIKVGVTKTGLYEISYDQLREMGFETPRNVALFGQGGRQVELDFVRGTSKQEIYKDDLRQLPVYHEGDKLYFYGLGTDWYEYSTTSNVSYFVNKGLNIYSEKGYYFLTDSRNPEIMAETGATADQLTNSVAVADGFWYTAHEQELNQGPFGTGQLFWGEDFSAGGSGRIEWAVELPGVIPGEQGYLTADFYKYKDDTIELAYGLVESPEEGYHNTIGTSNSSFYEPAAPRFCTVRPTSDTQTIYMEVVGDRPSSNCRLDHWTLTYRRRIPTLEGMNQDHILFPDVDKSENRNVSVPNSDRIRVMQVSDPYNPELLKINPFGTEGRANFTASAANPTLLYFDVSKPQLQICGFESIPNQNIHAEALAAKPFMAIVTTPEFYSDAERLAELHRTHLGQAVYVVTNDKLYNEFSSGHPDPMAYRAFVKLMHSANADSPETQIKNLLIYGPLSRDVRTTDKIGTPNSRHIAMQNKPDKVPFDNRGDVSIAFDFFGIMMGEIGTRYLEMVDVNVGVGYLTVQNKTEADNVYEKIRNYITDDSFAYRINKVISSACEGDNNMHVDQGVSIGNLIKEYQRGGIPSYILTDHTGYTEGGRRLQQLLDEGVIAWNYFGHSGMNRLGLDAGFFTSATIAELRNRHLPFVTFGGCDLTLPDHNMRGIGEHVILDNPYGAIAGIVSTRQAWSNPNETMMRTFYRDWIHENPKYDSQGNMLPLVQLSKSQSIGEVYARMKSDIKLSNELVYFLAGDPGITVPPVAREVSSEVSTSGKSLLCAGHESIISGDILKNGQPDADFNGEIVVRIMEPGITVGLYGVQSHGVNGKKVTFDDFQAAVGRAEVKNGKFQARVVVPASMRKYDNSQIRIVFGAYDHSQRLGASGENNILLSSFSDAGLPAPAEDTQAPAITGLAYNPELNTIEAEAIDDMAIATGNSPLRRPGCTLSIDGVAVGSSTSSFLRPSDDGKGLRMEFPLHKLPMGTHVATLEVSDAAGNTSHAEHRFEVTPAWASLNLSMDNVAADGTVNFIVEGSLDNSVTLCILDSEGNEIYSRTGSPDEMSWNCKNKDYEPVAPGLYKAYVRENGKPGHRAHSATIQVPVI